MKKSLVIVESPAKAKTINKFLGKGFKVMASVGHVKDLPKSKLGVDLNNNFKPDYIRIKGKGTILSEIRKAAKSVENVYLAPDPDREGEAIACHIADELKGVNTRIFRVLFNEITEKAILKAIKNPFSLDKNKFESQQARRILDRLVGYKISPILWKKVRRGLSAGRVQSVAVRIVCEREQEIDVFQSEEYWTITAEFAGKDDAATFKASLLKKEGKKLKINDQKEADEILQNLKDAKYIIAAIDKKEKKRNPLPPFITSKLQQDAVRKLGFTAKKTMMLAQKLYEGVELGNEGAVGLITYMRTDSTRIASEAVQDVRSFIASKFGTDYLPAKPKVYKSKKSAQDAHEAIRPTDLKYTPSYIEMSLSKELFSLYNLIWSRFVASQMNPATFDQTTVRVDTITPTHKRGTYTFQATGSAMKFAGFTAAYKEEKDEPASILKENLLPSSLSKDDVLKLLHLDPKQHFTQPPPRFTEASLVKELEENGIGRPSTYAAILSTIQDREYVLKEKTQFIPTDLGILITTLLVDSFPQILDVKFTAHMEEELDKIGSGEIEWVRVLKEFYDPFEKLLEKATVEMKDVKREEEATDILCDRCGAMMAIKWGKRGRFLGCKGYPECRNTKEFTIKEGQIVVSEQHETGEKCPTCGKPMIVKMGKFGKFIACTAYPECKTAKAFSTGVNCPADGCSGELVERRSKRGKLFYSCSTYPKCTFATWDKPLNEKCPMCEYPVLVEKYIKKDGTQIKHCPNKECAYKKAVA